MKNPRYSHSSRFPRVGAACLAAAFAATCCAATAAGEPRDTPPAEKTPAPKFIPPKIPWQFLQELEATAGNPQISKPFIAEYDLTGPRGDLHAELGRGENHLLYLKLTSPDPAKTDLPAYWCGEDGRFFMSSGGQTSLMPDAAALADAISALRVSLLGDRAEPFILYPNFWLQDGGLQLTAGEAGGWIGVLKDDPGVKTADEKLPTLEITSDVLGKLLVDVRTATIVGQEFNGRTMKRTSYQEEGAAAKVRERVGTFRPGEFEKWDGPDASEKLRQVATTSCRMAVTAVEEGRLSVDQLKANIAAAGGRFMLTMDRAFFTDRAKTFWDLKKMDELAGGAYAAAVKELKGGGLSDAELEEACGKIQATDLAAKINADSEVAVSRFDRSEIAGIARDLVPGQDSKTPEGEKAVEVIDHFLVESSIQNAVFRACERELRRQRHKDLD